MPNDLTTPGGVLAKEIAELTARRIDEAVAKIEPPAGKDGLGFNLKTYAKGQVYREGDYVVSAWGKIYVAMRDTADAPRKSEAWKRVGPWGLEFIGLKPEDTNTLECGDLYIDGGSLFGVLPDGHVKMLAQRGREGKQGPAGKDGKDGRHGASIVASVLDGEILRLRTDDETDIEVSLSSLFIKLQQKIQSEAHRLTFPIGTVIHSVSEVAPKGFYSCNGEVLPRDCKELIALLGGRRTPIIDTSRGVHAYIYGGG
jgi:hypothetical protein